MPQTVTSTADSGAGSLRQAITDANTAGGDTISFAIAGTGPHIITLASALPAVTTATQILGYSQSGATPNTRTTVRGSDAVLQIEINGAAVGSNPILRLQHAAAIAEGLALVSGANIGVDLLGGTLRGCWIGVRANGTAGACNGVGIGGSGSITPQPIAGGSNPGDRVIVGNCTGGIDILRSMTFQNVQMGVNAAGAFASNGSIGLNLFNTGAVTFTNCLIANHTVLGAQLNGAAGTVFTNCVFDENSDASWNRVIANFSSNVQFIDCTLSNYFQNGLLIDAANGVLIQRCLFFGGKNNPNYITFNSGTENQSIPTPTISAAATNVTETEISGNIAGAAASTEYRIEAFAGASGQMQRYLGFGLVTTNGSGAAAWTVNGLAPDTVGQTARVTITRTGTNETSRQSASFTLTTLVSNAQTIRPTGVSSNAQVLAPRLTADYTVRPFVVTNEAIARPPSITRGDVTVTHLTVLSMASLRFPRVTRGAITVRPTGVDSTAQVFAPTVANAQQVRVTSLFVNAEVLAPTVSRGDVTVRADLTSLSAQVLAPRLTANYTVRPTGVDSTAAIAPPQVSSNYTIRPTFASANAFVRSPSVNANRVIQPALTELSAFVLLPRITRGDVTVRPTEVSSNAQVLAPSVSSNTQTIRVTGIEGQVAIAPPILTRGDVTVRPAVTSLSSQVLAPRVARGDVTARPIATDIAAVVSSPRITTNRTVRPDRVITNPDVLAPAVVRVPVTIRPARINASAQVRSPRITRGTVTVRPTLNSVTIEVLSPRVAFTIRPLPVAQAAIALPPSITRGDVTVRPLPCQVLLRLGTVRVSDIPPLQPTLTVAAWRSPILVIRKWQKHG